jgi:hypothetical protein
MRILQNNQGAAVSKPPFPKQASACRVKMLNFAAELIAQTSIGARKTYARWNRGGI